MKVKERYLKALLEKVPDVDIDEVNQMTELRLSEKAYNAFSDVLGHRSYAWGFYDKNHNLYINIHGTESGQVVARGAILRNQDLGLILKNANLIDSNVNNIYTISCYGGLQETFEMDSGVTVSSSHTSEAPIWGMKGDKNVQGLISTDGGVFYGKR